MADSFRFVVRLALVYVLDWVVIVATIAFAGTMSFWATPNARPFSLNDPSIQFPHQNNAKIPTWLLVLLAGIIPAILIFFLTLLLPSYSWRRKLYSLNTAWLGLGLAIATGMIITDGLKNLLGRPRPDLISRCDPYRDPAWIRNSTIGPGELVDWKICRNRYIEENKVLDESDLRDGFRSFPSGHASMSFAGLTYFSMFLAEFVFLLPLPILSRPPVTASIVDSSPSPSSSSTPPSRRNSTSSRHRRRHPRRRPEKELLDPLLPRYPIMLALLICAVPVLLALYIASTRYSDFRHHPFDVIAGGLIGVFAGLTGWRWYGGWCCAGEGGRRGYYERVMGSKGDDETEDLRKYTDRRRDTVSGGEGDIEAGRGWRRSRE